MKFLKKSLFILISLFISNTYGQLDVQADLRPRTEYRHGFKTLFPDDADPAFFTSQRTRLNINYKMDKLNFYTSFQNIRVWGDVPQLNSSDANGISIQQAWGEILFDENFSLKLGRQEIDYDGGRIFGNAAWAQQSRSHDMALLKYKRNTFKMDVGLAFNQSKAGIEGTVLETPNTYKAIQYAWFHKDWTNFSGSFLFLNNGLQSDDTTVRYNQTIGTHLKSTQNNLSLSANAYYQFGNDRNNNKLSAFLLGLEGNYKVSESTKLGLGVELISGNDYDVESGKNNAFTPFYGTNHKFNGWMDYFYVGNHANSVGLLDIYAKASFKVTPKANLTAFLHNFSAESDINNSVSKQLGTEIDLMYSYKFTKEIGIKAGYSQLFASEGMEILKGNSDGNVNNWGWVMVTIKPTLFSSKK